MFAVVDLFRYEKSLSGLRRDASIRASVLRLSTSFLDSFQYLTPSHMHVRSGSTGFERKISCRPRPNFTKSRAPRISNALDG